MRAHQIMTRDVISVTPHTTIAKAATIMLEVHVSGLPVLNDTGRLVGIVSESDFMRRSEIGTGRKRPSWLQFILGPGKAASEFVRERGRKVEDVMTPNPITVDEETPLEDLVHLMETNGIKRLPVMSGSTLRGIVTRSNILQAVAGMAREVPDPTADDEKIRNRIVRTVDRAYWRPIGFEVTVRNGAAHLHGIIKADQARRAVIVAAENTAGVKEVHDHLNLVDSWSGLCVESTEDDPSHQLAAADQAWVH